MADRYWVGGAGTWDATTTTNWSATSGGASGASAPTLADNVIFNSVSNATAYAVTVGTDAVAADISISGPVTGSVTITLAATGVINCYGSWLNASTGVIFSATAGVINFLANTTGKTISTNSVTLQATTVNIGNGTTSTTGGWVLSTGLVTTLSVTVISTASAGFDTNGQTCSWGSLLATGSVARTISLGASAITLTGTATVINFLAATNLTFNAGTSTITPNAISPSLRASGQTFYNVIFSSASSGTSTIQGSNTFNNLTQTSRSAAGQRIISVDGNNTITGTLTLQTLGTPVATQRTVVQSDVIGTQRTITAAALSGLTDVDFRDIAAAGAASWTTGTRIGNLLNNSGITFTTGVNKYWNLAAGGLWSSTAWALSAGGAVSVANFPLAQDTVNIDLTTITTGSTINISIAWQIPTVICTRPSGSNTLIMTSGTISPQLYGNWTSCAGMSFTASATSWEFVGQGLTQTITSAGIPFTQGFNVNSPGGTVILADALTTNAVLSHTSGTLDLNNYTLTATGYITSSTIAHTLAFGAGKMVLTGNNSTTVAGSGGNLTVTGTAPLIQFTYSGGTGSRNIIMPILSEAQAISIEFINGASDSVVIQGASAGYKNITFTSFTGLMQTSNTPNIFGNLYTCNAMTASGNNTITFAGTSGTQTITTAGVSPTTLDFPIAKSGASTLQLQTAVTQGPTRAFTLTSGTLDLNNFTATAGNLSSSNSNTRSIVFGSSGKFVATGVNTTVFSMTTATGFTYTGTSRIEFAGAGTSGQTRTISGPQTSTGGTEANALSIYITTGSDTITTGTVNRVYKNIDFTGFSGTTFSTANFTCYGSLILSATMTVTSNSGTWILASTSAQTITTAGILIDCAITFDGIGGTWALQDALTMGSTRPLTLTNGTLNLAAGTTNTVGSFVTTGTSTKYLQSTTPGVQATISDASGIDAVSNLVIQDSNATGGATWDATIATNVNGGNNTGWAFFSGLSMLTFKGKVPAFGFGFRI